MRLILRRFWYSTRHWHLLCMTTFESKRNPLFNFLHSLSPRLNGKWQLSYYTKTAGWTRYSCTLCGVKTFLFSGGGIITPIPSTRSMTASFIFGVCAFLVYTQAPFHAPLQDAPTSKLCGRIPLLPRSTMRHILALPSTREKKTRKQENKKNRHWSFWISSFICGTHLQML